MDKHRHKNEWFIPSGSANIRESTDNSAVSQFVDRAHSLRTFYLVAGLCQIVLGLAVVTISVLGIVQPYWLSIALIMLGSVTSIIGLFLVYITVVKSNTKKSLLRKAMRRVIESKN